MEIPFIMKWKNNLSSEATKSGHHGAKEYKVEPKKVEGGKSWQGTAPAGQ
eukprot:TRINITY_DN7787_c0_g1_i1.p4 TRINITY_DN7787_c0_g1~~TRINITY_DN7787_c0_g1_i1.p4  ORF type:complete len:50 (-),score=10.21 TRINITY_DN7787_c0_g1_i1:66-215(-)